MVSEFKFEETNSDNEVRNVVITDIDINFFRLIMILIQIFVAAIPATIGSCFIVIYTIRLIYDILGNL